MSSRSRSGRRSRRHAVPKIFGEDFQELYDALLVCAAAPESADDDVLGLSDASEEALNRAIVRADAALPPTADHLDVNDQIRRAARMVMIQVIAAADEPARRFLLNALDQARLGPAWAARCAG